jgi:hypothetical protein
MIDLDEPVAAEGSTEHDDWEENMPTPSQYPLHSNEGRCGFLESYIWFGEVALFEAVGHLWALMEEPKNLRCIGIGIHAGTGGSGKWALAKFLRRALRETLDFEAPKPWDEEHADIHAFHQASMDYFAADRAHYERTIQKYADLLVGQPGRHDTHSAEIIPGPWVPLPPAVDPLARQGDEFVFANAIARRPEVNFSAQDPSRTNDHIL